MTTYRIPQDNAGICQQQLNGVAGGSLNVHAPHAGSFPVIGAAGTAIGTLRLQARLLAHDATTAPPQLIVLQPAQSVQVRSAAFLICCPSQDSTSPSPVLHAALRLRS